MADREQIARVKKAVEVPIWASAIDGTIAVRRDDLRAILAALEPSVEGWVELWEAARPFANLDVRGMDHQKMVERWVFVAAVKRLSTAMISSAPPVVGGKP